MPFTRVLVFLAPRKGSSRGESLYRRRCTRTPLAAPMAVVTRLLFWLLVGQQVSTKNGYRLIRRAGRLTRLRLVYGDRRRWRNPGGVVKSFVSPMRIGPKSRVDVFSTRHREKNAVPTTMRVVRSRKRRVSRRAGRLRIRDPFRVYFLIFFFFSFFTAEFAAFCRTIHKGRRYCRYFLFITTLQGSTLDK